MLFALEQGSTQETSWLDDKIDAFNAVGCHFQGKDLESSLCYVLKQEDEIVAGIHGCFYLEEILHVGVLLVLDHLRHQGLGSQLLQHLESDAISKGAKLAHLDTFDFQAKDFYLKNGYEVYGVLDDCPTGHKRFYMKKNLDSLPSI